MRNKLATIGLVTFLVLDLALVALALRPGRGAPASTPGVAVSVPAATTPTASASASTSGTATPTGTATTGGSTAPEPAPVTALVGALDATTAWRATAGSCKEGGSAALVTTDGGATWNKTKTPARSLARVQPLDQDRVFAVAAGADCALKQYASNDRGDSWQAPTAVSGGWARQLDAPTDVLSPQNDRAQPCGTSTDVIDLSRTSASQAQALCASGAVRLTTDGGSTWTDSGGVSGGLALGNRVVSGTLRTYVARVGGDCPGLQLVRVSKGAALDSVACIGSSVPAKPGQVGLAVVGEAGWLVVGNEPWVGSADLTTWKQPATS
ncbi:MAG: hypothetical protein JWP82_1755 [Humibacillus sp.]|nr:hypothetical protein [Humibacillus sp.]